MYVDFESNSGNVVNPVDLVTKSKAEQIIEVALAAKQKGQLLLAGHSTEKFPAQQNAFYLMKPKEMLELINSEEFSNHLFAVLNDEERKGFDFAETIINFKRSRKN